MKNLSIEIEKLNWNKVDDLMPAIIQDFSTLQVLMLGYMNKEALEETMRTGKVTFYSRTKKRLWVKGETSGHFLILKSIHIDCDDDALVILVKPEGSTCHLNKPSCFGDVAQTSLSVIAQVESIINQRFQDRPGASYVASLFNDGVVRCAQKVGEEGVEVALASVTGSKDNLIDEAADLFFHLIILLRACEVGFEDVVTELNERMVKSGLNA